MLTAQNVQLFYDDSNGTWGNGYHIWKVSVNGAMLSGDYWTLTEAYQAITEAIGTSADVPAPWEKR